MTPAAVYHPSVLCTSEVITKPAGLFHITNTRIVGQIDTGTPRSAPDDCVHIRGIGKEDVIIGFREGQHRKIRY